MISQNHEESDSGSDSECWSGWFCSTSGNEFFCQIKNAYIEDTFNLYGLKHYLPQSYNKALDLILDRLGKFKLLLLLLLLLYLFNYLFIFNSSWI